MHTASITLQWVTMECGQHHKVDCSILLGLTLPHLLKDTVTLLSKKISHLPTTQKWFFGLAEFPEESVPVTYRVYNPSTRFCPVHDPLQTCRNVPCGDCKVHDEVAVSSNVH